MEAIVKLGSQMLTDVSAVSCYLPQEESPSIPETCLETEADPTVSSSSLESVSLENATQLPTEKVA